jgi:hypothetical protein
VKLKRNFLLSVSLLLFTLSLPLYAQELSGWKEKNGYYKPFVVVENPEDKLVLFITPEGRVYRGKCRKREPGAGSCTVFPGKKFSDRLPLSFIVLELNGHAPSVVKTGVIGD